MPVGNNERSSFYTVDCKNACISQKNDGVSVRLGDYFAGILTEVRLKEWQFEGEKRWNVEMLFEGHEVLTFNAHTSFARMVMPRLRGVRRGMTVKVTPYFYENTCCGAISLNGEKVGNPGFTWPKPIEERKAGRKVYNDSESILLMTAMAKEINENLAVPF